MQNYTIRERIGQGGFSTVYRAYPRKLAQKSSQKALSSSSSTLSTSTSTVIDGGEKAVALKCIRVHNLNELNQALKEAQCCLGLSHPNIVKCHEFFVDKKMLNLGASSPSLIIRHEQEEHEHEEHGLLAPKLSPYDFPPTEQWTVCLAFEFCAQGTLRTVIQRAASTSNNEQKPIALNKILKWMFQILSALSHMHERKVLHRDVKPENVFLIEGGDVRLGDMGLAKQSMLLSYSSSSSSSSSSSMNANTVLGTSYFMAPEIRVENPVYNSLIDVWGAGCVLCELLSCKRVDYAYEMMLNPNGMYQLIDNRYKAVIEKEIADGGGSLSSSPSSSLLSTLKDMMRSMLCHDASQRPDCNTLLAKYFMASIPITRESSLANPIQSPMMMIQDDATSSSSSNSYSSNIRSYERLGIDCYILLFSFMTYHDIARCSMVCTQWHEIIYNSTLLYKILFQTTMNINTNASSFDTTTFMNANTMRDAYVNKAKLEQNWTMNKYKYAGFQLHDHMDLIATCSLYQGERITNFYIKRLYEKMAKRAAKPQVTSANTHGTRVQSNDALSDIPQFVDSGEHALVFTGSSTDVRLYDFYGFGDSDSPIKYQPLQILRGHTTTAVCTKFLPDVLPRLVFSGGIDRSICFYDILGTDTPLHIIPDVFVRQIWELDFLNSDILVVGGEDSVVKAYDIKSRSLVCSLAHDHKGPVYALKTDRSKLYSQCFVTGSNDGTVSIFDLRDGTMSKRYSSIDCKHSIYELIWDGYQLVTGHSNGLITAQDIRKWGDSGANSQLFSIAGSFGAVRGLNLDSTKISCGFLYGALGVYSRLDGKFLNKLDHNEDKKLKASSMSASCANESILMGADFNGCLSVYDFSCSDGPSADHSATMASEPTPPATTVAQQQTRPNNGRNNACRTQ